MKKFIYTLALTLILNSAFLIHNCFSQWQPDVRLTNNPAYRLTSNNGWSIASSGSVVHVVWSDERDGNRELYYKHSTDAGVTWGTDTRLTNAIGFSHYASIAVSGSVVHVVWQDERNWYPDIYYKRSTDAGVSWGADTPLTTNFEYQVQPSVALSGSVVHVVWSDKRDGNYEIYYKRSTDAGLSWGVDTRLTNDTAYSCYPSIAVSGSVVNVVWYDNRNVNCEIYNKRSTDSGISWGADTRLTNNTAESYVPSISVFGSVVHVVWEDVRDGNKEIYYKRSTDAGVNWGADTRLTNDNANSSNNSIAVSGSVVHVVWQDGRDGNPEIYYKRSTDAGISWGADTRLTNNSDFSELPTVAVSGTAVHIIWTDDRDGNMGEIYYKRNPTGNVGIQNISTETPSKYSLSQNYPNPFNPSTKIKFDVSKFPSGRRSAVAEGVPAGRGGFVTLKVYDALGREVQTLVNETLQPGTYETTFDGSNLNSGVYFYKLTSGDFSETKKMLLIK